MKLTLGNDFKENLIDTKYKFSKKPNNKTKFIKPKHSVIIRKCVHRRCDQW